MNSLLEGVSGFSCTNMQCLFIKVEIHSGLEGNVFDLMKFRKRKYPAGQILGFEKIIHFLTPSHYLFFLTVHDLKLKLPSVTLTNYGTTVTVNYGKNQNLQIVFMVRCEV